MIVNADCLEHLKTMRANSVDSIVTDPPAGIGFMGKSWDSHKGGRDAWIDWLADVMVEALRVLKPGGHALVWALPRTSHWTALALEDAGFEIRDCVAHIFGSGFPKSLDVSKAIDKAAGAERKVVGRAEPRGREGRKAPQGQGLPVVGTAGFSNLQDITAPATSEAKQWAGWGTALKPAAEYWWLVRKQCIVPPELQEAIKLCKEIVTHAEKNISPTTLGLGVVKDGIAQSRVQTKQETEKGKTPHDIKGGVGYETTVTCVLPALAENMTLSTALSWQEFLEGLLIHPSRCTIEMVKSLTIGLKTLNFLLSQIMQACMQAEGTGLAPLTSLLVLRVEAALDVLSLGMQKATDSFANGSASQNEEKIWLIRKPLSEKTVAKNVLKHGTGALNIDASRIASAGDHKRPLQPSNNARNSLGKQAAFMPTNAEGRFPANLILSHHDECEFLGSKEVGSGEKKIGATPRSNIGFKLSESSADRSKLTVNYGKELVPNYRCHANCAVAELDRQSGVLKSGAGQKSKNRNTPCHLGGFKPDNAQFQPSEGGASRFFYVPKASRRDKGAANTHPTVKNTRLMEYLITMITPPGGTVLDPFMGSGSTGVAAKRLGFGFIGIEKEKEYFDIAKARLSLFRD